MTLRLSVVALIIAGSFLRTSAQVSIQTDGSDPHPSAMLDVKATDKGVLLPRVALTGSADISTINNPQPSLLVYNTGLGGLTPAGFYFWSGSQWTALAIGSPTNGSGTLNQLAKWTPDGQNLGNSLLFDNGARIGLGNTAPDPSAILDISSTDKGILIPRMTYVQQQAISNAANGLLVFNTTSNCLDIYADGAWQSIYCSCPNLAPLNAITGATTVCSGTVQSYTVPAIQGASNYSWTVTGVPSGSITGNGSSSISFSAPALNTYTVSVVASNACNTSSVSQSLSVNAYTSVPPTPVWNPTPTNICGGANYNYTIQNGLSINGTGAITYTWTITATGAATATLTANSQTASAGNPVTYTANSTGITLTHGTGLGNVVVNVVGNNTCGTTATPLSFTQSVVGQPTVSVSPTPSHSVCTGAPITLTAGAISGTGNYTYQWYFNTSNSTSGATAIAGATGTLANGLGTVNYVLSTVNGSGASPAGTGFPGTYYYYCTFTPQGGTNCGPVASGFSQVTVVAQPTVTTQPTPTQTVCTGGGVTLTSGPSGIGSYTYQWFYNTTNTNSGGTAIGGATGTIASGATTSYTLVTNNGSSAAPAGTGVSGMFYYYCRFTPLGGTNCGPISSNAATVDVKGQPALTTQPAASQTVCTAASVNLSAVVSGTGNYTFQWFYNTTNSNTGGTAISGATGTVASGSASNYPLVTTNTTTASPAGTGVGGTFYYYCRFTPQGTTNCGPVTSGVATVVVNTRSADPTSASASVSTICNGGSTILTLNGGGGGTGEVIRWYAGSCGGALAGVGNNLSVSPSATTTYYGRYETPAPCSHNSACQSVTVTVNQFSVAPTALAASASPICTGSSTNLTQSGGSLGTGAVWRWYSNSGYTTLVGTGTGVNASLTVSPTTTTTYWLRAEGTSSPCGTNAPGPVGGVTVTVNQTSVLGTPSTAGPINFCDAGGNFGTPVTITGHTGTVNWQWGSSNGGWNAWTVGPNSGVNTFPKKVSASDGNPDRIRWSVTNGVCPATSSSAAILINNRFNEAPTALASNQNNYCTGTVVNITLTATFPTATNILGNVQFFSGSCGGPVVATVAGNGTTTVAATITAPTATTNYFVRYNPGTGSGCAATACVSTTVTVSQLPVAGTITQNPASGGTVCNGSDVTYTLGGHSGTFTTYKYQWNAAGGIPGSYTNWYTSNPATWPSGQNGASVLHVIAEVTNGTCPPAYTASVNVTVQSTVNNPGVITAPTTICAGASASITNVTAATTGTPASAGPSYYYYWQRTSAPVVGWTMYEGPTSNLSSAIPSAVTGTAGTYQLARNSAFGCAAQASAPYLNLTVNAAPAAPTSVTATPSTITQGASTNLNATSFGNDISWYTSSTGGSPIGTSASGANFSVTPVSSTTYYAEAQTSNSGSQTFSYTGSVQNFIVPAGVTSITIQSWGAQGSNGTGYTGGLGGYATGTLAVTAGNTFSVYVGGRPTGGVAGWNGGGSSGGCGGGGGGASDVRNSGGTKLIVAGGGGGGGCTVSGWTGSNGGWGGGLTGGASAAGSGGSGGSSGGTQSAGGTSTGCCGAGTNGTAGQGGNGVSSGCSGSYAGFGGGGGGGYYGGGGGGNCGGNLGGGGGSSYVGGVSGGTTTVNQRSGHGQVIISWSGTAGCSSASRASVSVTVNACGYTPGSQTFNYTGGAQSWNVPCGVTSVIIDAYGAQGGDNAATGGRGGRLQASVPVSPGQVLNIYVGGAGISCNTGGYNGGGSTSCTYTQSRMGGGASDVRIGGIGFANRVVVAGGGGGAGFNWGSAPCDNGGNAGGLIGSANPPCMAGCSGGGGSQASGGTAGTYSGWSSGVAGSIGQGGSGGAGTGGGGGGGGYFGGGGGSWCGGGGGSSYSSGTILTNSPGVRSGNGQVSITW